MRIIGIDPGYAIIGFGILEYRGGIDFAIVKFGAITTPAGLPFSERLRMIYDDMSQILDAYKPDEMGIEKLYFNTNTTTAIDVAQARGVTLLPAIQRGIKICEYTPLQVKMSITGFGGADKKQVQKMTKEILHLSKVPKPDDTADALALAICHGHTAYSLSGILSDKYKD